MGGAGTITLGVTGHRVLPDDDGLGGRIDDAIDGLAAGRAVRLLTSLAEGADRVVARRVLARTGGTIEAILPLEPDDYEADFDGAASVAEFRRLLGAATASGVVEVTATDGAGAGGATAGATDRVVAYEAAGLAVVARSEALVALWDGRPARGRGGTGDIVAHARSLGRPVRVVEVVR